MSATSTAAAGQSAAQRQMTDVVSLRTPGDTAGVWNETTHRTEAAVNAPFATGVPARIKPLTGTDAVTGDDTVLVTGYIVSVPLNGTGVASIVVDGEANTLIDVTASLDPQLVGRTLRIVGTPRGTYLTARRLLCKLND